MKYLPLLLDFNRISDITETKLGTIFELPDIDYLLKITGINNVLTEDEVSDIPGVRKNMDSSINNANTVQSANVGTTALPKLGITLKKVNYDSTTGVITY